MAKIFGYANFLIVVLRLGMKKGLWILGRRPILCLTLSNYLTYTWSNFGRDLVILTIDVAIRVFQCSIAIILISAWYDV